MAKKELTYKTAMDELQRIVQKLENDEFEIDHLVDMVHRATELINFCKTKLQNVQDEVDKALDSLNNENEIEK
jgi:exodeoxyribonuclease VII small subunit